MQLFGRSLLYKAHLTSPILFIAFLSLVLARRLSSACLAFSPTNYPFMVLHVPLENASQIFLQSTSAMMLPLASSILHYLRSTSMMWHLSNFSSNMSHCFHMCPSTRLWKTATTASKSSTGDCGSVMMRNLRILTYVTHLPVLRSLFLRMTLKPFVWWLETSRRSSRLSALMRSRCP